MSPPFVDVLRDAKSAEDIKDISPLGFHSIVDDRHGEPSPA